MSRQVNLGQIVPNIQIGTTTTGSPSSSAIVENVGTSLNPILNFTIPKGEAGAIKFEIVEQLPTTGIKEDTIYLVPYATLVVQELPTTGTPHTIYIVESTNKRYVYESNQWIEITSDNKYIEYIYVNGQWEELGGIGVDVDLSDYYTKSETNTLLSGKQPTIDSSHMLSSDLVDDTNKTNLFTNTSEKTTWNSKYDKPIAGIPKTDLDSSVQTSLGLADTSIQTETDPVFSSSVASSITSSDITNWNNKSDFSGSYNDLTNKPDLSVYELLSNKVISISSSSTDDQYPSAKCVYDIVGDVESILETLDIGSGV